MTNEVAKTMDNGIVNTAHSEALLLRGIQANDWLNNIRAAYKMCPYFEDIRIALGGKEAMLVEPHTKASAKSKGVWQFALENRLIRPAATSRLGIPKEIQQRIL
jgi:hypothetical protein